MVERVAAIQKFNGSDFLCDCRWRRRCRTGSTRSTPTSSMRTTRSCWATRALRVATNKNVPIVFTHHTRYEDYTHYVPFDSRR